VVLFIQTQVNFVGDCEHLGHSSKGHREKVYRNSAKLLIKSDQHCEEVLQPLREQVCQEKHLEQWQNKDWFSARKHCVSAAIFGHYKHGYGIPPSLLA
jgi:hypothetical protein